MKPTLWKTVLMAGLSGPAAQAQAPDGAQLGLKAAEARQASRQARRGYTWNPPTQPRVKGEVQSVRLETVSATSTDGRNFDHHRL